MSDDRPSSGPVGSIVFSGGQTGVDRAAWDAALELGLPISGWVPRGRRAEDGRIPERYGPLAETADDGYDDRTERNVRSTDATLVLHRGPPTGGTLLTIQIAQRIGRPLLALDLATTPPDRAAGLVRAWLDTHRPAALNVGGPRASSDPGIYALTRVTLARAWGSG